MIRVTIIKLMYFVKYMLNRKETESRGQLCTCCAMLIPPYDPDDKPGAYRYCSADSEESELIYTKIATHPFYGKEKNNYIEKKSRFLRVEMMVVYAVSELVKYIVREKKYRLMLQPLGRFGISKNYLNSEFCPSNINGSCVHYIQLPAKTMAKPAARSGKKR